MIVLILALLTPPQAPLPPQAPGFIDDTVPAVSDPLYLSAEATARRNALVFVVFVGCEPRDIPGCVTHARKTLEGYAAPCVVSSPESGWGHRLSCGATDAEILSYRKAVSQPAAPFRLQPSAAACRT